MLDKSADLQLLQIPLGVYPHFLVILGESRDLEVACPCLPDVLVAPDLAEQDLTILG